MADTLISVVDDSESVLDSIRNLLRSAGYKVATFSSAELFLNTGDLSDTECLILDLRMAGMDGLELQRRLKVLDVDFPIIIVTAHGDHTNQQLAMDAGASHFFHKPFAASDFLAAIQTALCG